MLDPLIKKIQSLSLSVKQSHKQDQPWLRAKQKVEPSLVGFNAEIGQLYELYSRCLQATKEHRTEFAIQVANALKTKYPLMIIQVNTLNPILDYINWQLHDLCVAHDWELHNVEPSLKLEYEGTIFERIHYNNLEQVSTVIKRQATVPVSITEKDNLQSISIGWISLQSAKVQVKRSKLVFRYLQLYPNLPKLYLLLSVVLESEHLMQPTWSSQALAQFNYFDDFLQNASGENIALPDGKSSLDRYSLFLLLAAYLDDDRSISNSSAKHLLGFCNFFKDSNKSYLVEGATDSSKQMKLNIKVETEASGPKHAAKNTCKLAILDPCLLGCDEKQRPTNDISDNGIGSDLDSKFRLLSITQELNIWTEVQESLGRLSSVVENSIKNKADQSIMASVLESSRKEGERRSRRKMKDENKTSKDQPESKADGSNRAREESATGATWKSKFQAISRTLPPYGLLGNIGFLMMFFVVRYILVEYISDQRKLNRSETLESLLELKKMVFQDNSVNKELRPKSSEDRLAEVLGKTNLEEKLDRFIERNGIDIDEELSLMDSNEGGSDPDEGEDESVGESPESMEELAQMLEKMLKEQGTGIELEEFLRQMEVLGNLGLYEPPKTKDEPSNRKLKDLKADPKADEL